MTVTRDFSTVPAPIRAPRSTTHKAPTDAVACTSASASMTALGWMRAEAGLAWCSFQSRVSRARLRLTEILGMKAGDAFGADALTRAALGSP